ncbi:MAG: hypothetical protein ACYDGX_04975 [Thermoleophilia bacterium]
MFFLVVAIVVLSIARILNLSGRPVEENVIQRWGAYLPGHVSAGEDYLRLADEEFAGRKTSFAKERMNFGLRGQGQPALQIKFSSVYSCYITYEPTGVDLNLHYILYRKSSMFYEIPYIGPLFYRLTNVISVQDHNRLYGFGSVTIDCAKEAASALMDKLDMDKAGRIKESSGQLGPL